jgi:hypothetical protein
MTNNAEATPSNQDNRIKASDDGEVSPKGFSYNALTDKTVVFKPP